jgi:hypothetical protein
MNKWWYIILFLLYSLVIGQILGQQAHAEPYIEVGLGHNTNLTGCTGCWNDGGGVGALLSIGYTHQINNISASIHWTHLSQLDIGPPFNNEDESSVDFIGVSVRFVWE